MKSLRLLTAVFIALAIILPIRAYSQSATPKASPSPKASTKASAKSSAKPSATPDKSGLPDTVALVEGKKIKRADLEAEFNTELAKYGQTADAIPADKRMEGYHEVLDGMIIDVLLKSRAATVKISDDDLDKSIKELKGTSTDAEFAAALKAHNVTLEKLKENIRVSLQVQKWIDQQIADKTKVSDDDAKSFYDKNPDQFQEVRVSHILIMVPADATDAVVADKQKLAQATKDRITKGEDFAKVAGEVSEDTDSKAKGGDLVDFFGRGSMASTLPEFEEAAFKLKKGEVSDPVRTKLGWHIIKVTDTRVVAYADVKDKIVEYLTQDGRKKAVDDLITDLRKKSDAKVFLPPVTAAASADGAQPPADQAAPAPADDKAPPKELGAP